MVQGMMVTILYRPIPPSLFEDPPLTTRIHCGSSVIVGFRKIVYKAQLRWLVRRQILFGFRIKTALK